MIFVMSYGVKFGNAHFPKCFYMDFNCRTLPNPHSIPTLRDLTGLDKPVKDYVLATDKAQTILNEARDFAIGGEERFDTVAVLFHCYGGRHRSVALAQTLYDQLSNDHDITVTHRELKGNP